MARSSEKQDGKIRKSWIVSVRGLQLDPWKSARARLRRRRARREEEKASWMKTSKKRGSSTRSGNKQKYDFTGSSYGPMLRRISWSAAFTQGWEIMMKILYDV